MCKKCNQQHQKCQLSYICNQCKLLNFELSPNNLAFDACENFPKLLEKFIIYSGLDIYKRIAEIAVGNTQSQYNTALQLYYPIGSIVYCDVKYTIRIMICNTGGTLIFDSQQILTQVNAYANQGTRREIQNATETKWGAQRRASYSFPNVVYQLYSAWLADVNLSGGFASNGGLPDQSDKRTEAINIRFLLQVDKSNNFIPFNGTQSNLTGLP